jgi:hypothetical protein
MPSYDTDWMPRDQIVSLTYQVGRELNDLKHDAGLIDTHTYATVASHLTSAIRLLAEVEALRTLAEAERSRRCGC